ncbi:MAG TPA: hypothetical protein VMT46_09710, partial [Anaerolineaceae bacterium]|nr:hypothetical protein [Anaerolineaceae bacterium]
PPAFILSQDQTLRKNILHLLQGVRLRIFERQGFLSSSSYHSSVVKVRLLLPVFDFTTRRQQALIIRILAHLSRVFTDQI